MLCWFWRPLWTKAVRAPPSPVAKIVICQRMCSILNTEAWWWGNVYICGYPRLITVLYMVNGQWSCIFIALFQSTDRSKHFTIHATFTYSHTHSYTDGGGCHARCQLHIRSNLGFSILLKDSWGHDMQLGEPGGNISHWGVFFFFQKLLFFCINSAFKKGGGQNWPFQEVVSPVWDIYGYWHKGPSPWNQVSFSTFLQRQTALFPTPRL